MNRHEIEHAMAASPLFAHMEKLATGEATLRDSSAKRHHFLPQMLLRRFLPPGGDRLHQLSTKRGANNPIAVDKAASRRRLYSLLADDEARDDTVETFLSIVEDHAASAIERLLADPTSLAPGDRATLAYFLALQEGRTPGAMDHAGQAADMVARLLLTDFATDPDRFADQYEELFGEGTDDEVEALRTQVVAALQSGEMSLAAPERVGLSLAFEVAGPRTVTLMSMRWRVLVPADGEFITSDRGVAIHDPTPLLPFVTPSVMSSPTVELSLPLARDRLLMVDHDRAESVLAMVDPAVVQELNLHTYGWAVEWIYGSGQKIVVDAYRYARANRARIQRPRPHPQVILIEAEPSDDSLARANLARGWPARLPDDGRMSDYVVIWPDDPDAIRRWREVDELARRRAARKLGSEELKRITEVLEPGALLFGS